MRSYEELESHAKELEAAIEWALEFSILDTNFTNWKLFNTELRARAFPELKEETFMYKDFGPEANMIIDELSLAVKVLTERLEDYSIKAEINPAPISGLVEQRSLKMERFEYAQVGDLVYSRLHGRGVIVSVDDIDDNDLSYPVVARFGNGEPTSFSLSGRLYYDDVETILFYIDGDNLYSETRPTPALDWSKVPVDTKVTVNCGNRRYYSGIGTTFASGTTSWSSHCETSWDIIILSEPVTIDGVTWPIGTKWERE